MAWLVVRNPICDLDHRTVRDGQHALAIGVVRGNLAFWPGETGAVHGALPVNRMATVLRRAAAEHHELASMMGVVVSRAGECFPGRTFERWTQSAQGVGVGAHDCPVDVAV